MGSMSPKIAALPLISLCALTVVTRYRYFSKTEWHFLSPLLQFSLLLVAVTYVLLLIMGGGGCGVEGLWII
jgi:hypothetical protein